MAELEKLTKKVKEHLESGEEIITGIKGAYETKIMGQESARRGMLLATNKRIIFYAKKLTGFDLEVFPYSNVSSIEMSKGIMGHKITFFASGNKATVKWIQDKDVQKFVSEVKNRIGKKEEVKAVPEVAVDIPTQIKKLAELKDQGILTEEEFETKKKELLAKL